MIQLSRWVSALCLLLLAGMSSAANLNYEEILSKALARSYDFQEAQVESQIKQKIVSESKYALWPEIRLKFTSEYVQNLADDANVRAVGDSVFSDQTQYQNYAYFDFSYGLIDFGVSRRQVAIAEMDALAAGYRASKIKMDIEKDILNLYAKLLMAFKEMTYRNRAVEVKRQLIGVTERSVEAGIEDKLEIAERMIEKEEEEGRIGRLEYEMQRILADISFYTGKEYRFEGLSVSDFKFEVRTVNNYDYKRDPEYKFYELQYQMKKAEIEVVKKKFFPKIDLYARYTYYGANKDNYRDSLEALRDRQFSVGIFTSIPLVENIKRQHTLSRAKLEASKTKLQMDKTHGVIERDYQKLVRRFNFYVDDMTRTRNLLQLTQNKHDMVDRLAAAKVMDLKSGLEQKLSLIDRELELEKQLIDRLTAVKLMMIQTEGY